MAKRNVFQVIFLLIAVLLMVGLSWFVFFWQPDGQSTHLHQSAPLTVPPEGGDFRLQSHEGIVALQDFRDKVVLLYFGYRSCPDICPTSLATLSMAWKKLKADEQDHVQILFISVDPERDTPALLSDYVGYFRANILGLTGEPDDLKVIAKQYGMAYRKVESDSALGYLVDHSANMYVIDTQGKLAASLAHGSSTDMVVDHVRSLLNMDTP